MNKLSLLLGGAALLFTAVPQTQAADTDPGYTSRTYVSSVYYRPTLRYYGKDYTVAYGFVPWDKRAARIKPVLVDDRFTLTDAQVAAFGGRTPRVTYTPRKQSVTKVITRKPAPVIHAEPAPIVETTTVETTVVEVPAVEPAESK
ncbi:MAG: hypothetical protein EOP50_19635 [Sphingobacteriales bacterium]|nr:MAG: hypothetical protein EOP50_19635 [Sphingobacteriales bacterium]